MPYSELANPRVTRETLDSFGLDTKYRLGQNFLIDDNVIGRILDVSGLLGVDEDEGELPSVLEIGPGIGTLTVALLQHARVVSVERDSDLPQVLAETTALHSDRFALIEDDALKVTREQIEDAFTSIDAPLPSMVVANLPYQIAATVILDWFQRFEFLQSMTVMVQSEVADRIAAQKGSKDYGAYSIKLRMYAKTTDRFQVSPSCFLPAPRVESAVIKLERAPMCDDPAVLEAANEVADAAFAQRRKNIRNSMKSHFDTQTVDALLAACDISPTVRGETLDPDQFLQMARELLKLRS